MPLAGTGQGRDREVSNLVKKIVGSLLAALILSASPSPAFETVRIGLLGPMTGSWSDEGLQAKQVVELIVRDLNEKGGILGKPVELIDADTVGTLEEKQAAAKEMASLGVAAVVGPYGSEAAEAVQGIFNEARILQVANGATAVSLSEKGFRYFFRTCPRDDEQGRVAASLVRRFKFKKIAVLHDHSIYARGLAEQLRVLLEKELRIVFFDGLIPERQDYSVLLAKMKAAGAEAVFFTGYYPEGGLLLRQKAELGWKAPFLGGDANNNPELVMIAGRDAARGFLCVSSPVPGDIATKRARAFLPAFSTQYGRSVSSIHAMMAGDGFLAAAAAMRETKSVEADKTSEFLRRKYKEHNGLTGRISFNEKGDRVGDVYRTYRIDARGVFVPLP
jgi:branched-chain amino acid transport system substrate-binding protein